MRVINQCILAIRGDLTVRRWGLALVFASVAAALLWISWSESTSPEAPAAPLVEEESQAPWGESFWLSGSERRQRERAALQDRLAELVERLGDVREATVVLAGDDGAVGLGRAHVAPGASVVVQPIGGALKEGTVEAIGDLVSAAVHGLAVTDVVVVDAGDGEVQSRAVALRAAIEADLGIPARRVVIVSEERGSNEVFVPWRSGGDIRTVFEVEVPRAWVVERAEREGSAAAVIGRLAASIAALSPDPSARVELVLYHAPVAAAGDEAWAGTRQLVLLASLIAILIAGRSGGRRRVEVSEPLAGATFEGPVAVAARLLELPHDMARQELEALTPTRRRRVLRAILLQAAPDTPRAAVAAPIVEVPRRLDRAAVRLTAAAMEDEQLALALRGLDAAAVRAVLKLLPGTRSTAIRQRERQLPPVPLRRIEAATAVLLGEAPASLLARCG